MLRLSDEDSERRRPAAACCGAAAPRAPPSSTRSARSTRRAAHGPSRPASSDERLLLRSRRAAERGTAANTDSSASRITGAHSGAVVNSSAPVSTGGMTSCGTNFSSSAVPQCPLPAIARARAQRGGGDAGRAASQRALEGRRRACCNHEFRWCPPEMYRRIAKDIADSLYTGGRTGAPHASLLQLQHRLGALRCWRNNFRCVFHQHCCCAASSQPAPAPASAPHHDPAAPVGSVPVGVIGVRLAAAQQTSIDGDHALAALRTRRTRFSVAHGDLPLRLHAASCHRLAPAGRGNRPAPRRRPSAGRRR